VRVNEALIFCSMVQISLVILLLQAQVEALQLPRWEQRQPRICGPGMLAMWSGTLRVGKVPFVPNRWLPPHPIHKLYITHAHINQHQNTHNQTRKTL